MTTAEGQRGYRIEGLSHLSGTTVRTIRAYTDRGLLPKPVRHGRANVYDDGHLARLRQIADLLERGYTLASIKELLAAWDSGTGLGGVLGLVGEVDRPWSDERPARLGREELAAAFGGVTDEAAIQEAVRLGVLVPVPDSEEFEVPSPSELAVAVELHRAGVPLPAITDHLQELRGQVEHISQRFLEFTTEYVFERFLDHPPSEEEAAEAAGLIRRLRPLAQQTVDAELARAMRLRATEHIRRHLGEAVAAPAPGASVTTTEAATVTERGTGTVTAAPAPATPPSTADVPLPEPTVRAVRDLVGAGQVAAFVAAAAEREVAARRMDALTATARRNAAAAATTATDPDPDGNGRSHLGNSGT
ncbi:MerR family transcriptional regulator [Actinacidiphila guanduensis]|uniref:MerR HTH family regulatory protein n=1 Tax=Actinacidiphila guanduensis TaxID=310781 RepID=A0A1G9XP00_9ACTN|nr:MerR family transcriptional regulator [Actinacidiphila guanduensis]SDM98589.1 MerR HTH family regulatory protein [Actinacidiphila guanduensis]